MKILLLLVIVFIHTRCAFVDTTVHICESRNATSYHYKKNCRGLGNCTYKITETTLEKAKKSGKKLCGWEK